MDDGSQRHEKAIIVAGQLTRSEGSLVSRVRVLREEPLLAGDEEVIRGGPLSSDVLRTNAEANFRLFGFYGLSVFCASGIWSRDRILGEHLRRFSVASIPRVDDLRELGLKVLLTGREPHGDIVGLLTTGIPGESPGERESLVAAVASARHHVVSNPYFGEEEVSE